MPCSSDKVLASEWLVKVGRVEDWEDESREPIFIYSSRNKMLSIRFDPVHHSEKEDG